jgi:hypothetical protein
MLAAEEKGVTFVGEYLLKSKKTRKKKNKPENEKEEFSKKQREWRR